ncbi:MAG TPA: hypothetical protein VGQ57_09915, partial [Polyangiaceae bacterium]|nr:hypothetical protein [Polyangiaceae bacterium]
MKSRLCEAALFCAAMLQASPLFAQIDEATRTAARALGTAGVQAYQAGDYAAADDKLEKAYSLLQVPTLGLWSGRALVKLGKWVEATDRFLEVASLQVPAGEYAVQKQAQADATTELKELTARVPLVTVKVENAQLADCSISIDGQPVATSLLTAGRLMNPGSHVIEGKRGTDVVRVSITVAEGDRTTASLKFPAPVATPAALTPVAATAPVAPEASASPGAAQRTWGWVTLGVGGAGLVVGAVTGGVALGKKHQIDDNSKCSGDRCAPSEQDLVDSYNGFNTVSSIAFIGGG